MSAVNPYSPPEADVRDASASRFSQPRIWSWRGRIGRLRFLAYAMGGYLVLILAAMLGGALGGVLGSEGVVNATIVITLGVYFVQYAMAAIQRSHDMDWSGWTALGLLIPLVNLIWIFKAGTPGANRWGEPPVPNTLGVKLLAWTIPVVMVLGLVAAVSIPAYKGYVDRAKAAQGQPR